MVAVLILSGGRSQRMGTDKASLSVNGKTLLQWQVDRFRAAGFEVVSELKDRFPDHRGPLAGLLTACMSRPDIEDWLILPVDVPWFSIAAAHTLIHTGEASARPVCYQGHPMPAYVPVTNLMLELLNYWLDDPEGCRSMRAMINRINGIWLDAEPFQKELFNVNTPGDWQTFLNGETL